MIIGLWVAIGVVGVVAVIALIAATSDDVVVPYPHPRYCPYCRCHPCDCQTSIHTRNELRALSVRIDRLEREHTGELLTFGEWERRRRSPPICLAQRDAARGFSSFSPPTTPTTPTPKPRKVDVTIIVEAKERP